MPFQDLLAANADHARNFDAHRMTGRAAAGVLTLTCMDSRIEPLAMLGLTIGDAKILRTPGGQLTPAALNGVILAVQLLGVTRVLVITHTRCAMASDDETLRRRIAAACGLATDDLHFGADPDQAARLAADVAALREHPLVGPFAEIGGFHYAVETGRLDQRL